MEQRYARNIPALTEAECLSLREKRALIVGCGGLGGHILDQLARIGVGFLRVVDGDVFSASNMNRQILATVDTIGRNKSDVAVERARSINPDIDIEAINMLVSEETIPMILEDVPDVLADAIDTIGHKVALIRYAAENDIVTFSSMGAALHMDTLALRVDTLKRTKVCPLAASVRSRLRDVDTSRITCVYSEEKPLVKPEARDEHGKSILGSLPTVPAVFGMTLANQIILHLIQK